MKKRNILLLPFTLFSLIIGGCNFNFKNNNNTPVDPVDPDDDESHHYLIGITLSHTEVALTLNGTPINITATLSPVNAEDVNLTWSVSDTNIVSLSNVSNSGVTLTALSYGETTLTVKNTNGVKATCKVFVVSSSPINYRRTSFTLSVGDKTTLINDETDARKEELGNITYSYDSNYVDVSDNGIITAKALGKTVIIARGSKKGEEPITVNIVNTKRNLGFSYDVKEEVCDQVYQVTNLEEFYYAIGEFMVRHYRSGKINVNTTTEIDFSELFDYFELRNLLANFALADVPVTDDNFSASISATPTSLPAGNYVKYVGLLYSNEVGSSLDGETSSINGHDTTELTNLSTEIRHYYNNQKNSTLKRSVTYNDFYLEKNNKGYLDVYNSEELWWVVNNGYLPNFVEEHSSAEEIYERAKDVLRSEITNDMTDQQKFRAIYDWLSEHTRYDYEALNTSNWLNNTAWYLEGTFFEGRCVCDAYSRAFNLLAGIEGLTSKRGTGFVTDTSTNTTSGHAWNYGKVDDTWYLFCTTWAQGHLSSSKYASYINGLGVITSYFDITLYDTFGADLDYMTTQKGYSHEFYDSIHNSHTETKSLNPYDMDYVDGYDFEINSIDELRYIFTTANTIGASKYYFACTETSSAIYNNAYTVLNEFDLTNNFTSFSIGDTYYFIITK